MIDIRALSDQRGAERRRVAIIFVAERPDKERSDERYEECKERIITAR